MISTHVLDTSIGIPAANVTVELAKYTNDRWELIKSEKTNSDGRIVFNNNPEAGVYRLKFGLEDYFLSREQKAFFVVAPIVFNIIETNRKYHIPLLLSPFGYSTYRGS